MPFPNTDEIRVGSVLRGTYEITSVLGEGGMGYVFAARHVRLPKQFAVKVLKTGLALSADIVARFRREAEIASRLNHPNIVEVIDFDTLPGGTPFLVLEFLNGESLARRLERGPLPWDETREIALQVGSALLAAHRAGVVHRDLKPDNIFLLSGESTGTTRHRVKLLDFGISKLSGGSTLQTQDAVLMGTPQYMSPEQALGNNSAIDARSDVFALACIYYEMLAGRPAFSGDNIPTVIYRIVHDAPRPLPEVAPDAPPHVWPVLERAFRKDTSQRTPGVATLTEELTGTRLRDPQAELPSAPPEMARGQTSRGASAEVEKTFVPPKAASPEVEPTLVPGPRVLQGALPTPLAPPAPVSIEPTLVPAPRLEPAAPLPPLPAPSALQEPPRGEASPAAAPVPAAKDTDYRRLAIRLAAALVIAVSVTLTKHAKQAETPPPQPVTPAAQTVVTVPAPPAVPVQSPAQPLPEPAPQPAAVVQPARHAPAERPAPVNADSDPVDLQARAELELSEKALAAGNAEEALFRAQRSLRIQRSGHAISALTRAYCAEHDLSNAQAQFQNVPRPLRAACVQWCGKYEIELGSR